MSPRPEFAKKMPKWNFEGEVLLIRKFEAEWVPGADAQRLAEELAPVGMLFPDGVTRPLPVQQVKWKNGLDGEPCTALVCLAPDVHEVFAAWLNNPVYTEGMLKAAQAEATKIKRYNAILEDDLRRFIHHYSFCTNQPWWIRLKWVFTGIPKEEKK